MGEVLTDLNEKMILEEHMKKLAKHAIMTLEEE